MLFNRQTGPSPAAWRRGALSGVVKARDLVWRTLGRFAAPARLSVTMGEPCVPLEALRMRRDAKRGHTMKGAVGYTEPRARSF